MPAYIHHGASLCFHDVWPFEVHAEHAAVKRDQLYNCHDSRGGALSNKSRKSWVFFIYPATEWTHFEGMT